MERAWKINNYYELLGIPEDISKTKSETEIEKIIYKRRRLLTQIYHPDGFQTESDRRKYDELFKFINLAVETLIDRAKRNKYDENIFNIHDILSFLGRSVKILALFFISTISSILTPNFPSK